MSDLVDVVEVQIKAPHERRVMERGLTKENADAYIKLAVMRRGVENQFYTTQPTR
jgi:hypothetical protein